MVFEAEFWILGHSNFCLLPIGPPVPFTVVV